MSFVPIKNLISQAAIPITPFNSPDGHRGRSIVREHGVFQLFRATLGEVCGDIVGAQIWPLYINSNTLVVVCLTQAAGDIIRLKEKEIIDKVNWGLKESAIKQLWRIS